MCFVYFRFASAGFQREVMNNVQMANYHKPTPVQKATIPYVMAGRDIMGCAQTGSGKTVSCLGKCKEMQMI